MEKTFSDAFNKHLKSTGRSITEIAQETGVGKDALYSLHYGKTKNMGVIDAVRVARAFGKSIETFMDLAPATVSQELALRFDRLTPREQQILLASLDALLPDDQPGDPDSSAGATEEPSDH